MRVKNQCILCRYPRRELFKTRTKTEAALKAPWAMIIIDVDDGGYLAFESIEDYRKWALIDACIRY